DDLDSRGGGELRPRGTGRRGDSERGNRGPSERRDDDPTPEQGRECYRPTEVGLRPQLQSGFPARAACARLPPGKARLAVERSDATPDEGGNRACPATSAAEEASNWPPRTMAALPMSRGCPQTWPRGTCPWATRPGAVPRHGRLGRVWEPISRGYN